MMHSKKKHQIKARVFCVEYKHNRTKNIKLGWGKFSNYTIAPDGGSMYFNYFCFKNSSQKLQMV